MTRFVITRQQYLQLFAKSTTGMSCGYANSVSDVISLYNFWGIFCKAELDCFKNTWPYHFIFQYATKLFKLTYLTGTDLRELRGDHMTNLLHETKFETAFHKLFIEHLVLHTLFSFEFAVYETWFVRPLRVNIGCTAPLLCSTANINP